MSDQPFVATAMNGETLTVHQGFPLRLLMPGWYGAPQVKWLANIHLQQDPYLGKFQARWYRTLRGEMIGGEMKWKETAITRMRLKSVVARVARSEIPALAALEVEGPDVPVTPEHVAHCARRIGEGASAR